MMHHEGKVITFMWYVPSRLGFYAFVLPRGADRILRLRSGENVCGPLMLACMSECSDMPLACVCVPLLRPPLYAPFH